MLILLTKKNIILFIVILFALSIASVFFILPRLSVETQQAPQEINESKLLTLESLIDRANRVESVTENLEKVIYTPPNEEFCGTEKTEAGREECFDKIKYIGILKTENIKDCLGLNTVKIRDNCLQRLATASLNHTYCQAIADIGKRAVCIDSIVIDINSKEMCDEYFFDEPNENNECKDRISAFNISGSGQKDDIYECEKIKSLEYPIVCLERSYRLKFNNNCEEVPVKFRDHCITYKISGYAKTEEECALIPLEGHRKYCVLKVQAGDDINKIMKIDSDNDGFPDGDELFTGTDPYNEDTDGDGLGDYDEMTKYHTSPKDKDSDGDGLSDGDEVNIYATNPAKFDTDDDGVWDGEDDDARSGDADGDGLPDRYEAVFGTDPNNPDTDGDGVSDGDEALRYVTNPLGEGCQHDTDGDGLIDIDEVFYRTNGLKWDTDGDGISDYNEVKNLTNPLGEGDMDFDGDGLSDKEEEKYGTNPSKKDTNNDGVDDLEAIQKGIEAVSNNTNGLNDLYDEKIDLDLFNLDTDNDGLSDSEEINKYHTNPNNPDTDGDGYSDGEEVKRGYNPLGEGKL